MRRNPLLAVLLSLACTLSAGCANSAGIVHYDIDMEVLAEQNAVRTSVCCTIRNDSPVELTQLAFDLLAREERCKAHIQADFPAIPTTTGSPSPADVDLVRSLHSCSTASPSCSSLENV